MPHTKSAKKRLKQSLKNRDRNRRTIKNIKVAIKKVQALAKAGDVAQLKEEVKLAVKKLDKAAYRRIVHPNQAARKKSQLARLVHAKEAASKGGNPG